MTYKQFRFWFILGGLRACREAKRFCRTNKYDFKKCWDNCPDDSWLRWIIRHTDSTTDYLYNKKLPTLKRDYYDVVYDSLFVSTWRVNWKLFLIYLPFVMCVACLLFFVTVVISTICKG